MGALIFAYRDEALLTGHPEDPDLRTNRTDCRLCAGAIYEYGRGVPIQVEKALERYASGGDPDGKTLLQKLQARKAGPAPQI